MSPGGTSNTRATLRAAVLGVLASCGAGDARDVADETGATTTSGAPASSEADADTAGSPTEGAAETSSTASSTGADGVESTGSTSTDDGTPSDPAFKQAVLPLLVSRCAHAVGCHDGSTGADGELFAWPTMTEQAAYEAIVGVASRQAPQLSLIEAHDVDGSYLWHKINDTQSSVATDGVGGARMPMIGTELDAADKALLHTWIENGAGP